MQSVDEWYEAHYTHDNKDKLRIFERGRFEKEKYPLFLQHASSLDVVVGNNNKNKALQYVCMYCTTIQILWRTNEFMTKFLLHVFLQNKLFDKLFYIIENHFLIYV